MPTTTTLLTFLAATIAILLVPGPSVSYVIARSLESGRAAGLLSMLGLETGALLHVIGAALGLSALLASSDLAFQIVKYGGACYLVHLGVRQVLESRKLRSGGLVAPRSNGRLYVDGMLVDLLNPKTALFFLAFLPQFIDADRGSTVVQIVVLGLVFVLLAALTDSTYALLAGRFSRPLQSSPRWQSNVGITTGGVYLGLAGLTVIV